MSVQAITWALKARTGSASHKAVLLVVANYADEWGRCWPSLQTIAEEAECSVSTAQRSLKAMEEAGLVSRTDRRRKNGSFTSDELTLQMSNQPAVKLTSGKSDRRSKAAQPAVNLTGPTTFEPSTTFEGSLRSPSNGTTNAVLLATATPAQRVIAAVNSPFLDPSKSHGLVTRGAIVAGWLKLGIPEPLIVATIAAICERQAAPIGSWRYFDAAVRQAAADAEPAPITVEFSHAQRPEPYARTASGRPRSVLAAMASDLGRYSGGGK